MPNTIHTKKYPRSRTRSADGGASRLSYRRPGGSTKALGPGMAIVTAALAAKSSAETPPRQGSDFRLYLMWQIGKHAQHAAD